MCTNHFKYYVYGLSPIRYIVTNLIYTISIFHVLNLTVMWYWVFTTPFLSWFWSFFILKSIQFLFSVYFYSSCSFSVDYPVIDSRCVLFAHLFLMFLVSLFFHRCMCGCLSVLFSLCLVWVLSSFICVFCYYYWILMNPLHLKPLWLEYIGAFLTDIP